jgi:hypothetical protein
MKATVGLCITSHDQPERQAAESARRKNDFSRRRFMYLLAVVTSTSAVLGLNAARTQGSVWREYRRDDLGFRIEMPGEPKIEVKDNEFKDNWIRSVGAQVQYEEMLFAVDYAEYRQIHSADDELRTFREGMRLTGFTTREIPLVVDGFPACDFIEESELSINFIHRVVVVENVIIIISVVGGRSIHSSPTGRRVLDSFRLLRRAR